MSEKGHRRRKDALQNRLVGQVSSSNKIKHIEVRVYIFSSEDLHLGACSTLQSVECISQVESVGLIETRLYVAPLYIYERVLIGLQKNVITIEYLCIHDERMKTLIALVAKCHCQGD